MSGNGGEMQVKCGRNVSEMLKKGDGEIHTSVNPNSFECGINPNNNWMSTVCRKKVYHE